MIRTVQHNDHKPLCAIYNHYVEHSIATFDTRPLLVEDFSRQINNVIDQRLPWLIATCQQQNPLGFAYAKPWKSRAAYRHAVEVSVYLAPEAIGQGLGARLYTALFSHLKDRRIHTALAGISLPNDASVALHEKIGMKKVAHIEQVGRKFNRWIDVGYWQRLV